MKPKKPASIEQAEWDFRSVPANEARACMFYEYGRSSNALIAEVERRRALRPKLVGNIEVSNDDPFWVFGGHTPCELLTYLYPSFPKTPYQSAPNNVRREFLEVWERGFWEPLFMNTLREHSAPSEWEHETSLNWSLPDSDLRRAFERELQRRPHPPISNNAGGRGDASTDRLNRLMALRLRRHFNSAGDALIFLDRELGAKTPYNSESALNRACREAEKFMEEIFATDTL